MSDDHDNRRESWLADLRDDEPDPAPRRQQPDSDRRYTAEDMNRLRTQFGRQIAEERAQRRELEERLAGLTDVEAELTGYRERESQRVEALARRNQDTFRNLPKQLQRLAPGDPTDEGTDQDQLAAWLVTAVGEAGAQSHVDRHGLFAQQVRPPRSVDPEAKLADLRRRMHDVQLGRGAAMPRGAKR